MKVRTRDFPEECPDPNKIPENGEKKTWKKILETLKHFWPENKDDKDEYVPDIAIAEIVEDKPIVSLSWEKNFKAVINRMRKHMETYPEIHEGFYVKFIGDKNKVYYEVVPCDENEKWEKINWRNYKIVEYKFDKKKAGKTDKDWLDWQNDIKNWQLKKWEVLELTLRGFWDEWAKDVAENLKLEEDVQLHLNGNLIWDEWARAIAECLELKKWVLLNLSLNCIWDEWVRAISKMELKEWVTLDLSRNDFWDEWVEAIMMNLKLKDWVKLDLRWNRILPSMVTRLKEWERSFKDRWINCDVIVDSKSFVDDEG